MTEYKMYVLSILDKYWNDAPDTYKASLVGAAMALDRQEVCKHA